MDLMQFNVDLMELRADLMQFNVNLMQLDVNLIRFNVCLMQFHVDLMQVNANWLETQCTTVSLTPGILVQHFDIHNSTAASNLRPPILPLPPGEIQVNDPLPYVCRSRSVQEYSRAGV